MFPGSMPGMGRDMYVETVYRFEGQIHHPSGLDRFNIQLLMSHSEIPPTFGKPTSIRKAFPSHGIHDTVSLVITNCFSFTSH